MVPRPGISPDPMSVPVYRSQPRKTASIDYVVLRGISG